MTLTNRLRNVNVLVDAQHRPHWLQQQCDDAADEIEELCRRLADCVVWMDTREKMGPGMPRLCDMARDTLKASMNTPDKEG